MATRSSVATASTTAARVDNSTRKQPQGFSFFNLGAVTVYFGGSDVTSANGAPVAPNSWSPGIDLGVDDAVYVRTASSTAEIRVLEVGV